MKKSISILLAAVMALSFASCAKKKADVPTDDTKENVSTESKAEETKKSPESETKAPVETDEVTSVVTDKVTVAEDTTDVVLDTVGKPDGDKTPSPLTQDEALAIAKSFVGDKDPDLGYTYSVQFDSVDKGTYCFKVSMYIEDQERYSTCGYVLVDPEGNAEKYDW